MWMCWFRHWSQKVSLVDWRNRTLQLYPATPPAFLLAANFQFQSGAGLTEGLDGNDRIIYNTTTGALYYDPDGDGAAAAVQFATLGTGLALTAADFFVV